MRLFALAVLLVVLTTTPSFADEFERNPDRFPSIGLNLSFGGEKGTTEIEDGFLSADQDTEIGIFRLTLDTRVPVSNSWTLYGALSLTGTAVEMDETFDLAGSNTETGGITINLGARYYFNK